MTEAARPGAVGGAVRVRLYTCLMLSHNCSAGQPGSLVPRPGLGSLLSKVTRLGLPRLPLSGWVGESRALLVPRLDSTPPPWSVLPGLPPARAPGPWPHGAGSGGALRRGGQAPGSALAAGLPPSVHPAASATRG